MHHGIDGHIFCVLQVADGIAKAGKGKGKGAKPDEREVTAGPSGSAIPKALSTDRALFYASQLALLPTPPECLVQTHAEFMKHLPPVRKGSHCKTPFPPGNAEWDALQISDVVAMMDAICRLPRMDCKYKMRKVQVRLGKIENSSS